jgi:large subunit ribosomal protein L9
MPKVEVILTKHIIGLGGESDQVRVAAGYARNYLLPQGFAIPLTGANKRRLEALKQRRAEREAHELNSMTELAASLSKLVLTVKVKTGDDGKMFGSVTAGTIADELKHQFDVALDKKKVHLEKPIRGLGEFEIDMHLHPDVRGRLKLRVESSNPPPEPPKTDKPAPAAAEATRSEGRKEQRPRPRKPKAEQA